MKRGVSKLVQPRDSTIDVLISYQAYCLKTGTVNKSLKEVLCSRSDVKVLSIYYDTLRQYMKNCCDLFGKGELNKIVSIMSLSGSHDELALAYVMLNAALRVHFECACVISINDMIGIANSMKEVERRKHDITAGTISYYDNAWDRQKTLNNVIMRSTHSTLELLELIKVDSPWRIISNWLLSDWFEPNTSEASMSYYKSTVMQLFGGKREDICHTVDNAQSILNSLPMFNVYGYVASDENMSRNIKMFIDGSSENNFYGSHTRLAFDEVQRAVVVDDIYISTKKVSDSNVVLSVASGGTAYSLILDKEYLECCYGVFDYYKDFAWQLGDGLNMLVSCGSNQSIDSVREHIKEAFTRLPNAIYHTALKGYEEVGVI